MRFLLVLFLYSLLASACVAQDSLALVLGRFDPATHPDFSVVPTDMANKEGMYIRVEVLDAFKRMRKEAQKEGIVLNIVSATRNFDDQKRIWEAKWNGTRKVNGQNLSITIPDPAERAREILKYSSMPGTSRHHWGTDIDINSVNPTYFESDRGDREYEWLRKNASRFGFCQVYSEKGADRKYGYEEEKWHWSYVPTAKKLLSYWNAHVTELSGFAGSSALPFSDTRKYVLGLSPECNKVR